MVVRLADQRSVTILLCLVLVSLSPLVIPIRHKFELRTQKRSEIPRTTPFRVLAGLGEARLRSGNSIDFAASDALGRLIDAIRMTPPLRVLEEVLRPT